MSKRNAFRTLAIAIAVLVGLTAVNLVLKITGVLSLSWWFVFIPLWAAPLVVIFALGCFMLLWSFVLSNATKQHNK